MKNKTSTGLKLLRITGLFLLLTLFLSSCTNQPVMPTAEEAKDAVWKKIEMANDRWAEGDPMGFVDVAADDITWMDDLGAATPVVGKEAVTAYLESFKGQVPPHQHELSDNLFQNYGDIVIVTYRYRGTFENVPQDPWKVTSVYRYADGDWLSVHENWTVVKSVE